MRGERGLLAAVGIVMAFSILWTLAILVPDESSSNMTRRHRFDGLDGDGNHYVLGTNDQTNTSNEYRVIHIVKSSAKMKSPANMKVKRKLNDANYPLTMSAPTRYGTDSNKNTKTTEQPRTSSFTYAWFALFICYHARTLLKRKNRRDKENFVNDGLNQKLEYGLEYEDDYSVDTSFYGSISSWNEFQKFDLDDESFV